MTDEELKIMSGQLFCPGDPQLRAIKLRCHKLCQRYNAVPEDDTETRDHLIHEIVGSLGQDCFFQGPIQFHYGTHCTIGDRFFGNFNLTIQDDAPVTIGSDCSFGPNVTIVTPLHPILPGERKALLDADAHPRHMCYAKPVHIGHDCWFGANVVVCPGVTIGHNCVVGAGSVVTRDIPANSVAYGNPVQIRPLRESDSLRYKPEILGNNRIRVLSED